MKRVNCMGCELYLNKAVKQTNVWGEYLPRGPCLARAPSEPNPMATPRAPACPVTCILVGRLAMSFADALRKGTPETPVWLRARLQRGREGHCLGLTAMILRGPCGSPLIRNTTARYFWWRIGGWGGGGQTDSLRLAGPFSSVSSWLRVC